MKKLSLALFTLLFIASGCQSQSVSGVYSGVELRPSAMIGGGMDRIDITIYLRPDKTFGDDMEKPDWKTAVTGHWSVSGKSVKLTYNDPKESPWTFDIISATRLRTPGGYSLVKMDIPNSIPKGVYEFKHMSGGGGGVSGVPYVASGGTQFTMFDGKGNFSRQSESFVAVTGDNIGGGSSNNKSASGTYTVKDGELTLNFGDGHKTTHSVLVSHDNSQETMLVVDGDACFLQTPEELAKKLGTGGSNKSTKTETDESTKKTGADETLSAATFVDRVKAKHGGAAIDQLKSIAVTASVQGLDIRSVIDFDREWSRLETRQGGKLLMIEQLESNSGWQWLQGRKTVLTPARVKELRASFSTGLAGLRNSKIAALKSGTLKTEGNAYALTYTAEGEPLGLVSDKDFKAVGEARQTANGIETITYSDFRELNGILIPYAEKHTVGKNVMTIKLKDLQLNTATSADFEAISD